MLTIAVDNAGDVEANLFNAIADAKLADIAAKTYAIHVLRSDLPDKIPPRGSVRGRLVFDPLPFPPAVQSATLTLPGIRVGESSYDATIELKF